MAADTLPDRGVLLETFSYNPETGELRWRERPASHFAYPSNAIYWNRLHAGTLAGWKDPGRYISVKWLGQHQYVHRIIFKMMAGYVPLQVDHINGQKSDNRWCNLRRADNAQNHANLKISKKSTTGLKGAHRNGRDHGFRASLTIYGKFVQLGWFPTAEEAHAAYCKAAKLHFGKFWNPG